MGMKPIASRKEGWIINPTTIESCADDGMEYRIRAWVHNDDFRCADLPDNLTFAQFLDQYNRCTDSIYFID